MTRITGDVARSMVSRPYDALAQFGSTSSDRAPVDMRSAVRWFGAGLLLVTGVAGAIWLTVLIHAVVFRPHTVGLTKHVSDAEIRDRLARDESSEENVRALVDLALERGGSDNVTAVVGKIRARS